MYSPNYKPLCIMYSTSLDMRSLKYHKCTELITYSTWCMFTLVIVGNLADLIFVFFDPIGQALCKRTLNLVGKLTV